MATTLPLQHNTNSTGTSSTRGGGRASLASFPTQSTPNSSLLSPTVQKFSFAQRSFPGSARSNSSLNQSGSLHSGSKNRLPRSPQNSQPSRPRPVKSQYPKSSTEKHVEYILVASFDIDRGSVMEHQYPAPVGGDEHMLAELMLPDQAHVRSQDWTIFFLHKDAGQDEEELEAKDRRRRRRRRRQRKAAMQAGLEITSVAEDDLDSVGGDDEEDDLDGSEADYDEEDDLDESDAEDFFASADGPPLVYVLNLVNTKQDNTVKRGAVVKAMAICTRHSFLHIYKPLLLLALEQYFQHPTMDTLASLYDAVNSMDLSLMPKLNYLEKFILQATEAKDLFLERFEAMIEQSVQAKNKEQASLALDAVSANQSQTRTRYGLPRDTHEFESIVHYANVPVPVKIPTAISAETVGDFSLIKLITVFSTPHTSSPMAFNPMHPHLTTAGPMTHPIIVLINALLTEKRVIFLGHNLPSSDVAEAVLAACALASGGLLRGFTRHAFPYTDLTKIDDLLKVPGFIAGVTNPAFAHKSEWWDLLCDLGTGRMRISNRIEQAPMTEGVAFFQPNGQSATAGGAAFGTVGSSLSAGLGGHTVPAGHLVGDATGDAAFMTSVLASIQDRHGENAIRSKFRRWIVKFTRLAADFEETVYGATAIQSYQPNSPSVPFSDPNSPAINSPRSPRTADEQLSPEVMGHGYVWPTQAAKNIELAANSNRIEAWRTTRSYYNFIQDLAIFYSHRPIKTLDIVHLHDKLAKLRLTHEQSANIYLALASAIHSDAEICQMISIIANGIWDSRAGAASGQSQGLLTIGMGLFHPRLDVREEVAELIGRIRDHEAGRHFWNSLGRFVKTAWERVIMVRSERMEKLNGNDDMI